MPEDDRKVLRKIVCVKLKDDIHSPGEMNGQIMALKEHVKARYRLSDLIRAQKNDKMTSAISPKTTSRALRSLLTRGGNKSVRIENRYTEAYGPHEVMLNIDGINIYTKTMITCDEDLAEQIYVVRDELKVRSIGHCAMLEEDTMHIGTEADVSAHVLDISGKKTQLRGLLDTGAFLSVIPIET